jgi:hypothetical protein
MYLGMYVCMYCCKSSLGGMITVCSSVHSFLSSNSSSGMACIPSVLLPSSVVGCDAAWVGAWERESVRARSKCGAGEGREYL